VFKIFAIAQGLELDLIEPDDMIDTRGPMRAGGFTIRDYHSRGAEQTVHDVFIHSSNIGTVRIAQRIGGERQRAFLDGLGLLVPAPVEVIEARNARPLSPARWTDMSTMTISYGHGVSTSLMHLAGAYATMVNGGTRVVPTLLRQDAPQMGARIISEATSAQLRVMMRATVTEGTATFADVEGYAVGGKTGTADMPNPKGGYYDDRNITTFASAFPMHAPRYVLVAMLQEAVETSGPEPRRTAGWTVVPVAAEIIRRAAPLMGLRPEIEPAPMDALSSSSR
jgi:cell division protein FtsI (penicillin-binding protein 3)